MIPAGTGSDCFTGIDNLFAFAAAAEVKVIYSLRMLSTPANPIGDLHALHAQATGHIWSRYRDNVASFAIGNEPDWHAYHTYPNTRWIRRSSKRRRACQAVPTPPT